MAKESVGNRVLDMFAAPAEAIGSAICLLSAPLLVAAAVGSLGLGNPLLSLGLFKAAGISANAAIATNTGLGVLEASGAVATTVAGLRTAEVAVSTWVNAWSAGNSH